MKPKADYEYIIDKTESIITIIDLDLGNMSVTNDIENVIYEISQNEHIFADDYKIHYIDSEGNLDGWNSTTDTFYCILSLIDLKSGSLL